jgi:hypothetical protein
MKRRLAVLCLMAAPLAVRAQTASTPSAPAQSIPEWQAVVGPELRFRFEMPTPIEKVTAPEKEKGHATPRIGWSAKRDGQMFDFDFVDYDDGWFSKRDSREMAKELGRGEAEKAFPKDKYKYARDEPVQLQGWDGYALDIEDAAGVLVMMRTYIVKDRLYRLLVTATADSKTREAANRFLDSFKLAEARP